MREKCTMVRGTFIYNKNFRCNFVVAVVVGWLHVCRCFQWME